ncbi:MAG: ATP-grasp domain-containing protein [Spirochaetaceae bacterium]|nr:ATP-grasp domain-containing protein [Spirochaetaceae bacterium]
MITKLLIANRGEIAVRIIRACKELGIKAVAVYSSADRENLHVRLADEAVCIGPASSAKSYLNAEALITVALRTGCDAIHPGVGFLSENAAFARETEKAGLLWIGPKPKTIELLGDKVAARATAIKHGLPVTPGSDGAVETPEAAEKIAEKCGYPVIIKAASGGGGKGMRIVWKKEELAENLKIASSEALSNFADGTVYVEKYIVNPRHVELQILADGKGGVAVLGERDCSVQKNHQKLIEESPSPAVTQEMRSRMYKGAVSLFSALKYRGAGTIEFLVTGSDFYFMEVNARVQVEHPVSEFVSGVDIIREQILACTENRLTIPTEQVAGTARKAANAAVALSGWAIEARINAMAPGTVTRLEVPSGPGVRFDSFLYQGYTVLPYYDSMVAKLIVHDTTREMAIKRLLRCLDELVIEGIPTNLTQQKEIISTKQFKSGVFGTSLYEELYG